MSDPVYDQIQEAAEFLRLDLTAQEMAALSVDQNIGEGALGPFPQCLGISRTRKRIRSLPPCFA